ncbi:MAG: hypothetical protein M0Q91_05415 [Methanoregula sp.]|jgi:hypothetical protein|nr:hypothetical protein [Methanoregula sp.]
MRELAVIPTTLSDANRFVNQFHRHNNKTARNGGKFAIGATHPSYGLVGVAIVGNPIARSFMDGFTAEVLRVCVAPESPKNVNSFLYGACWRIWVAMGGKRLVTYTLQSETGISLKGAGWELTADVKPQSWDRGEGRRRVLQNIQTLPKYRWEQRVST